MQNQSCLPRIRNLRFTMPNVNRDYSIGGELNNLKTSDKRSEYKFWRHSFRLISRFAILICLISVHHLYFQKFELKPCLGHVWHIITLNLKKIDVVHSIGKRWDWIDHRYAISVKILSAMVVNSIKHNTVVIHVCRWFVSARH